MPKELLRSGYVNALGLKQVGISSPKAMNSYSLLVRTLLKWLVGKGELSESAKVRNFSNTRL